MRIHVKQEFKYAAFLHEVTFAGKIPENKPSQTLPVKSPPIKHARYTNMSKSI